MTTTTSGKHTRGRVLTVSCVVAVVGWAAFLAVFAWLFPSDYPRHGRAVWWLWVSGGTAVFVAAMLGTWHLLAVPRSWRTDVAVALLAPALCLDAPSTIYAHRLWGAGPALASAYSATILGGVGVLLLLALAMTRREPDDAR